MVTFWTKGASCCLPRSGRTMSTDVYLYDSRSVTGRQRERQAATATASTPRRRTAMAGLRNALHSRPGEPSAWLAKYPTSRSPRAGGRTKLCPCCRCARVALTGMRRRFMPVYRRGVGASVPRLDADWTSPAELRLPDGWRALAGREQRLPGPTTYSTLPLSSLLCLPVPHRRCRCSVHIFCSHLSPCRAAAADADARVAVAVLLCAG